MKYNVVISSYYGNINRIEFFGVTKEELNSLIDICSNQIEFFELLISEYIKEE